MFDIADMKCLRTLETAPNPDGVMALSPNEENCHLAFPDGAMAGSSGGGGGGGEVKCPVMDCVSRVGLALTLRVYGSIIEFFCRGCSGEVNCAFRHVFE